jgi:hypothetical protein
LEDLGLDGRIMALQYMELGGIDWIDWAQDRDRWQTLFNVVMNLQVP